MTCPRIDESGSDFISRFRSKVRRGRIPLSGTFELTRRCNLRCVHCYLGSGRAPDRPEMTTEQVCRVLDESAAAGCLTVLLTGGEPLLRTDFPEIYRHARRNGMLVTVFTNGTVLPDAVLDLLCELPPRAVEISLYGASEATYESVTGSREAYRESLAGLDRLLERGVPVRLKTILMALNRHEFADIRKIAMDRGVRFHHDASICPCLDGDRGPLQWRLSAREAADLEFEIPGRAAEWEKNLDRVMGVPVSDRLFLCGAGNTGFHVSAFGDLQPCLMIPWISYDLLGGSFADGWQEISRRTAEQRAPPESRCRTCRRKNFCGYCPAFFRLETGSEGIPSDFVCELGGYRIDKLRERGSMMMECASEKQEATAIPEAAGQDH